MTLRPQPPIFFSRLPEGTQILALARTALCQSRAHFSLNILAWLLPQFCLPLKDYSSYELRSCYQQVVAVCIFEIVMAWAVREMPWWKVLLAAYVLAGTASQNLFTAQHELSHFLAFRKPLYNRILSIASNCPLVIPMATSFRKYHQEHHSHLVSQTCMMLQGELKSAAPSSL